MKIEKLKIIKNLIEKIILIIFLFMLISCENDAKFTKLNNELLLAVLSISRQPESTFNERNQTYFRQIVISSFSKYSELATENKEKAATFSQEIQGDLAKVTYSALRAKGEKEIRHSSQTIRSLLEPEYIAQFEVTLNYLSDPAQFSANLLKLEIPAKARQISNELSNSIKSHKRGFIWSSPGPAGWYCYSPIFGKMGPHPDFWFSAIVCAWAKGVLVVANGKGCYVFNDDPSFFCW